MARIIDVSHTVSKGKKKGKKVLKNLDTGEIVQEKKPVKKRVVKKKVEKKD